MNKLGGLLLAGFAVLAIYGIEKQAREARQNDINNALQEQWFRLDRCNRHGVPVSRCDSVHPDVVMKWIEQDMGEMDRKLGLK